MRSNMTNLFNKKKRDKEGIRSEQCVVNLLFRRIQSNATRLGNLLTDENHSVLPSCLGNLDPHQMRVQPIEIPSNPVIDEAFDNIQSARDDFNSLRLAFVKPHDLLGPHFRPENCLGMHVRRGGDDVDHVDRDAFEGVRIEVTREKRAPV